MLRRIHGLVCDSSGELADWRLSLGLSLLLDSSWRFSIAARWRAASAANGAMDASHVFVAAIVECSPEDWWGPTVAWILVPQESSGLQLSLTTYSASRASRWSSFERGQD